MNLKSLLLFFSSCFKVLHPKASSVNINKRIWDVYFKELLPLFVKPGDDGNYASTAASDLACLQVRRSIFFGFTKSMSTSGFCLINLLILFKALSRRIHYGKFVAEVKFRDAPHDYEPAIRSKVSYQN